MSEPIDRFLSKEDILVDYPILRNLSRYQLKKLEFPKPTIGLRNALWRKDIIEDWYKNKFLAKNHTNN